MKMVILKKSIVFLTLILTLSLLSGCSASLESWKEWVSKTGIGYLDVRQSSDALTAAEFQKHYESYTETDDFIVEYKDDPELPIGYYRYETIGEERPGRPETYRRIKVVVWRGTRNAVYITSGEGLQVVDLDLSQYRINPDTGQVEVLTDSEQPTGETQPSQDTEEHDPDCPCSACNPCTCGNNCPGASCPGN